MKNTKFNTNFLLWGVDIHIHSNSQQLFDTAVDYFHKHDSGNEIVIDKRIDFYFENKKLPPRSRWNLKKLKKETSVLEYIVDSWSRAITVKLDYKKGIIKNCLSPYCNFPREAIEDLLIFRPLSIMLSKYGFFTMHAGCVEKDGKGIIIPGSYGKGKTITTLNLVRKGCKFLGDEYLLLKKLNGKIKAHAFPQRIGIKKNLIKLFPELKFLRERDDSPKRKKRFWIDEAYPKIAVDNCHPQLIIFPCFNRNSILTLNRISKKEALYNILKDKENVSIDKKMVFKDVAQKYFDIFSSLVKQADIYDLEYSDDKICNLSEKLENLFNKM